MGVHIDVVISIEVADEVIVERMSGRRVCSCGASYHVVFNPPAKEGICDRCGSELYIRRDDDPATVQERLKTYHTQTEPLKDFYAKAGILEIVQGREDVADTTKAVFEVLKKFEG